MNAQLTIIAGDEAHECFEFEPGQIITLGRHRGNQVVLRDLHASRQHAEVFFNNGHWFVRDCGTLNGTRLNGQRIHSPQPLAEGSEIGVGDTRLVFSLVAVESDADEPSGVGSDHVPATPPDPVTEVTDDTQRTVLHADELRALCSFMAASVEEASPRSLIARALTLVHSQTGASVTGFLSLDAENPLPQVVLPERANLDAALSRQLTRAVQKQGRMVWLSRRPPEEEASDSLASLHDAVCVPLRASDTPLGALHVYKNQHHFSEREVLFVEVLAAYLAKSLFALRGRRNLAAENVRLRGRKAATEEMVGASPALERVRQQIEKIGPLNNTVLITGESGVGKELVAHALHRKSRRCDGPLVIVHCGAISPNLLESELFGHVRGAFTGADRDKPGYFQQADYGTLFLDEIGEMSPECQVKVLRVIEGKPFRPVGGTVDVQVDVRVIAATHRDLEKMVRGEKFRHDLFYRLEMPIHVPPLRERLDDIEALAEHFLAHLGREYRKDLRLTRAAVARLKSYSWPGNVRQLRAVLGVAAAMTDGGTIDAADLRLNGAPAAGAEELNLEKMEARAIREALRRSHGVIGTAADILGVHRDTLSAKMKKYDISRHSD